MHMLCLNPNHGGQNACSLSFINTHSSGTIMDENDIGGQHFIDLQHFAHEIGSNGLSIKTWQPLRNVDNYGNFHLQLSTIQF